MYTQLTENIIQTFNNLHQDNIPATFLHNVIHVFRHKHYGRTSVNGPTVLQQCGSCCFGFFCQSVMKEIFQNTQEIFC